MGTRLSRLFWIVALALGLRACVFESVRMTDGSMAPVLHDGDVVLVSKLRYGLRMPGAGAVMVEWSPPRKGELVVAASVGDPPVNVLRRITAVAGDKVTGPDGKELTLKEGEFFLAAEQKDGVDSRKLGPVSRKAILGKASYVWSPKRPVADAASRVESPKSDWKVLQPL